jgi:hypothetical protein
MNLELTGATITGDIVIEALRMKGITPPSSAR